MVAKEARYLLNDAHLSLEKVSKRLRLKKSLLRRIRDSDDLDNGILIANRHHVPRFNKIHQRARELIDIMLDQSKTPLTLRDL